MANKPNMGYSSAQANEMLMGLPGAMAAMGKKAYMGLGSLLEKKIIEASRPKYGMDEIYPGELSGLKPVSTEGNPEFIPFVNTDQGYEARLPGIAGDAYNAFTASRRSMTDPNFNAEEEGVNMGLNLMGGGAFGKVPPGALAMNAYHGSPHRFPPTAKNPLGEFDPMKVGTGEGVQAYGTGAAYLAENPEVARQYKEQLTKGGVMGSNPIIETNAGNIDIRKATNRTEKLAYQAFNEGIETGWNKVHWLAENWTKGDDALRASVKKKIDELDVAGAKLPSGSFYKVDLPDDRIAKMLDYDKPLSEQHPDVQSALAKLDPDTYSPSGLDYSPDETGQMIYMRMANSPLAKTQADASEVLRQAGIPGIRYLDGGSRADGKGTSNFVVFDPADMTILERNGMTAQDVLAQEGKGLVPPVQRVAPSGLVVANKYEKGIIQGKPGDLHFSVHNDPQSKKMGELLATGFADSQGNFYDRNQALEFVRQSNPDQIGMQDYLKRASGLDAKDYNATTGVGITDAIPEARKYNIVPPVKKQGK